MSMGRDIANGVAAYMGGLALGAFLIGCVVSLGLWFAGAWVLEHVSVVMR